MIGLGGSISRRREALKLTLTALSKLSGVSSSYLCEIEAGDAKPSWDILTKIATALETKLSLLIQESERG
jgi:transcriptional regulator with XRE-family HTH domain